MYSTARLLTLTTSLNISDKTPVLILRVKESNVGLVISGITLPAGKALVERVGITKAPATSLTAPLPILMKVLSMPVPRFSSALMPLESLAVKLNIIIKLLLPTLIPPVKGYVMVELSEVFILF